MKTRAPGGVDVICRASLVGVPAGFAAEPVAAAEPAAAEPVVVAIAAEPVLAEPDFAIGVGIGVGIVAEVGFAIAADPGFGAAVPSALLAPSCHAATPPPPATATATPAISGHRLRGAGWLVIE